MHLSLPIPVPGDAIIYVCARVLECVFLRARVCAFLHMSSVMGLYLGMDTDYHINCIVPRWKYCIIIHFKILFIFKKYIYFLFSSFCSLFQMRIFLNQHLQVHRNTSIFYRIYSITALVGVVLETPLGRVHIGKDIPEQCRYVGSVGNKTWPYFGKLDLLERSVSVPAWIWKYISEHQLRWQRFHWSPILMVI